ncbi:DUF2249 domain-containing protein [Membranicola marinus]|uniref:DUF2249 domain-containing protein n=1 Tax=Membranihabitans marinus TaxID=1227546 RepID=A0A953I201_9BACT|nr:DUF2249 domain-containing protein [Membranihabitans marinus]MBY5959822.1 DUF2249 domain-containing protein [Membranihabitans marinus]
MEYNERTKISKIIQHDKTSIDAIARIAPPLKRLKNPILRKIMASRVTVAEAASMGGCQVEDFIRALKPLGYLYRVADNNEVQGADDQIPDWLEDTAKTDIHSFDVRPIIENGTDPLKAIMAEFKKVGPSGILCIINTFVPTPLIHLLEKKLAEKTYIKTINEKEYHTYFLKKGKVTKPDQPTESNVIMDDENSFDQVCHRFTTDKKEVIDVRHLEMPLPMQTILGELEELPENEALYIHHKRVPIYLLEELADGNFEVHIHSIAEGNVKMLIFHSKP